MAPLSRRAFLRSTAAATAAAAALPAVSEAGDPKPRDPFGGFTVGLQSYSLRHFKQLDQVLQRIHDLGLRYVEFYREHVPVTSTDAQIKAVRNLCREHNVTPIAFGVERFTKDHAANRRLFEFARNLGVRYLSADPDPESFESLDKLVGEFDIAIAIHPHGPINNKQLHRYYSAQRILDAVRGHDRRIGSCLDTGHLIRCAQPPFDEKLDPAAQVRAMGTRNFGLHLKDHDNQNHRDVVFGKGPLDVLGVLRALREVKFQGYISIEYEANPENPIPDIRACLDVLRESVRKLT
jgi:sugar phosphate isomerase/epimerase